MSLIDKIKDLFTDEEEVYETKEVEIEENEEHKVPTIMRKDKDIVEEETSDSSEVATFIEPKEKKEKKLSFEFDDDDFVDQVNYSRTSYKKTKQPEPEKEAPIVIKPYSNKKEQDKTKKFKPTPVISPVYGVLDKNYRKDEVVSKDEESLIQRPSKKLDFDSVRSKAYGTLTDDIKDNLCENCEYLKEVRINKKIERLSEEDLLYNMTVDTKEEVKEKVTLDDNKENDAIVDLPKEEEVVTAEYEDVPQRTKKEEVKIVNHTESEPVAEKIEVKEETLDKDLLDNEDDIPMKTREEKNKDLELTDDLFNLIDSMYKERTD